MEKELIAKTANGQDVYLDDETMEHIASPELQNDEDIIKAVEYGKYGDHGDDGDIGDDEEIGG